MRLLYSFNRDPDLSRWPSRAFDSVFRYEERHEEHNRGVDGFTLSVYRIDDDVRLRWETREEVQKASGGPLLCTYAAELVDVWARACALSVAHLWRPNLVGDTPGNGYAYHRLGGEFTMGWESAIRRLWSLKRSCPENTREQDTRARVAALRAAGLASRQRDWSREQPGHRCTTLHLEEGAYHAAGAAEVLLSSTYRDVSASRDAVNESSRAIITYRHRARYAYTQAENMRDSILRSLISAVLYVDGHAPFEPSPYLDWWWYWQVIVMRRPIFLWGGSLDREEYAKTRNMLTSLRGEDSPIMRRLLLEAWRRYWVNRKEEPRDWPVVWAARHGGGTR